MRLGLLLTVVVAATAHAGDVWTTPYPGVRMLARTTTRPIRLWALEVDSCAPGIRFRVSAPSEGNRTTSSFGRLVGAQLAINGDFADHDFGLNVGNGQVWPYPDTTHSGNFSVGSNRLEMTADNVLLSAPYPWVTQQLGGRWTLLSNGVPRYGIDDNGPTTSGGFVCAPGLRHPRTAIGLSADKRKVFIVVADGRSSASVGMTCDELIDLFVELGAHDAMGLDGGGSSTLWKNDALINHPTDSTGERTVRNHLAIFASGSGPAPHCGAPMPMEPAQAARVTTPAAVRIEPLTAPTRFTPLEPRRLFDTRTAADSVRLRRDDGTLEGPLSSTNGGTYVDWAAVGVPSDATSVWLNVATLGASAGFLTVFPDGRARPGTSNLNFADGQVRANSVSVALGTGRGLAFELVGEAHVIADTSGAFSPTGQLGLDPLTPTRALDTRSPLAPLQANVIRAVPMPVPVGTRAVTATVTVVAGTQAGYLTAFACGTPRPATSNVNFAAGEVNANTVLSEVSAARELCLVASAETHVVVDVTSALSPSGALRFVPVTPQRVLDTRGTSTPWTGRLAAGQVVDLGLQALAGMPVDVGTVVANVTATSTDAAGFVTVFPCGGTAPATSSLNFPAGGTVGALTVSALGNGSWCARSTVRAHLIVDVLGVWARAPVSPPDAGMSPVDAGVRIDAGVPGDAGVQRDAGVPSDAGVSSDAGVQTDAGMSSDAAVPSDAGAQTDAGVPSDAGVSAPRDAGAGDEEMVGMSCSSAGGQVLWLFAVLLRRRSARR